MIAQLTKLFTNYALVKYFNLFRNTFAIYFFWAVLVVKFTTEIMKQEQVIPGQTLNDITFFILRNTQPNTKVLPLVHIYPVKQHDFKAQIARLEYKLKTISVNMLSHASL